MLKKLFTELFKKLKKEETNDSHTTSGSFKFFVENILEEKYGKASYINPRTLVDYYNKYVLGKNNKTGKPKNELKNLISIYLEFEDYVSFEQFYTKKEIPLKDDIEVLNKTTEKDIENTFKDSENENSSKAKYIIGIAVALILSVLFFINKYKNSNSETCIIWQQNHFEKSSCATKKTIDNAIYNIDIEDFKKIEVNLETTFFKDGIPLFWYGKSLERKMEFFTNRGIHPETLDELKPVTPHIINKYVYKDETDKTILN